MCRRWRPGLFQHLSTVLPEMLIERERKGLVKARTRAGKIALVPTMGNLHDGHLSLVDAARGKSDEVWVSLFVNPLQFGQGEDFGTYPRTFDEDVAKLEDAGATLLFAPSVSEMYPGGVESPTRVSLPPLAADLCGRYRPGHFDGACTVVLKLFNLTGAAYACFGEKDYQQLTLIKRMVLDLNLAIEIVSVPTMRENDGLAMSSRNTYLDGAPRRQAPSLYVELTAIKHQLEAGRRDFAALERAAMKSLEADGWAPDYVAIRGGELQAPEDLDELRVLGAARLGATRLIDNVKAVLAA